MKQRKRKAVKISKIADFLYYDGPKIFQFLTEKGVSMEIAEECSNLCDEWANKNSETLDRLYFIEKLIPKQISKINKSIQILDANVTNLLCISDDITAGYLDR